MIRRHVTLILFMLFVITPSGLYATAIDVIISSNGMVLSSDSLTVNRDGLYSAVGSFTQKKFVLIQQRIVIAVTGTTAFKDANGEFDFLSWMHQLSGRIASGASVDDVTSLVERESAIELSKLHLDEYLNSGILGKRHFDSPCEKLIQFIIAGYQDGKPRLYSIEFDVNWKNKNLSGPIRILQNPSDEHVDYRTVWFGAHEAAASFINKNSYAHQVATQLCPDAIKKIDNRALPNFDETVALSRAFIQVEKNTNPDEVGGPIETVMWLADGHAQEWSKPSTRHTKVH